MTLLTLPAHPSGLTAEERDAFDFMAFIAPQYRTLPPGRVMSAVHEWIGMDLTRAVQITARLLDDPRTMKFRPAEVMRMRAERATRSARRNPHLATNHKGETIAVPRRRLADVATAAESAA